MRPPAHRESPWTAATEVRVASADVDKMGVARQERYLGWLQQARQTLVHRAAEISPGLVVSEDLAPQVETYLRFLHPVTCDEVLEVQVRPAETARSRFCLEYRILRKSGRETLAEGRTVHVFLGPSGRPGRLPPRLRAVLAGEGCPS